MVLGASIRRLADVAELVKTDLSAQPITLASRMGVTIGFYKGAYSAAAVRVEDCGIDQPISIGSVEFQSLSALFADALEVGIRKDKNALLLANEARRVSLRFVGQPSLDTYDEIDAVQPVVEIDRQTFVREITIAATACAVKAMPILTGIRIAGKGNLLGMQTSNGASLAFEVGCEATVHGTINLVAPAADIQAALRIVNGDKLTLGVLGRTLVLKGTDSFVRIPTLAGQWPNLNSMKAQQPVDQLKLPAQSLRILTMAAKAYQTDSDVHLEPADGGVLMSTSESELGQYVEAVGGQISKPYNLHLADLEVASKMSDEVIDIDFCKTLAIARVEKRRLFMLMR